MKVFRLPLFVATLSLVMLSPFAFASSADEAFVYLSGEDSILEGTRYGVNDSIETTVGMTLRLPDGSDLDVAANSKFQFMSLKASANQRDIRIRLTKGGLRSTVVRNRPGSYRVSTPSAIMGVRGTDFSVFFILDTTVGATAKDGVSELDVFEGQVGARSGAASPEELIGQGEGATISDGSVVRRTLSDARRIDWDNSRDSVTKKVRARLGEAQEVNLQDILDRLPQDQRELLRIRITERLSEEAIRAAAVGGAAAGATGSAAGALAGMPVWTATAIGIGGAVIIGTVVAGSDDEEVALTPSETTTPTTTPGATSTSSTASTSTSSTNN